MTDGLKFTVDYSNVMGLFERLKKQREVKTGLEVCALHLKGKMAQYPAQRHGKAIWSSNPQKKIKQIRAFFAKLNSGEITVPYQRGTANGSQKLGQSWTNEARSGGLTQVIGTRAAYAQLVQSAAKQTQYHKISQWKTEEQVLREETPHMMIVFNSYIGRMIS
jgi:hypothetical protein